MTPVSYKDPFWSSLAQKVEQEVGLPANLLQNILLKGERSNADQVSSAGAKTPFQVIPETRQALLKKYNVDAYAGPEQAAKAAALLLKESLERNQGDITQAVGEYIGGTNRKNWGPVTNAYIQRVTTEGKPMVTAQQFQKIYKAYESGQMSPQEAQEFEADMGAGVFGNMAAKAPQKAVQTPAAQQPMQLPTGVVKAYREGRMTPQERSELEADINAGLVSMPVDREALISQIPTQTGAPVPEPTPTQKPGIRDVAEAGLSMVSGATTGMLGGALGVIDALPNAIFGKGDFAETIAQGAKAGFDAGTYDPSREAGRQLVRDTGEFITQDLKVPPVLPIIGPTGALAPTVAAQRPIQQAAQAAKAVQGAAKAAPDVPMPQVAPAMAAKTGMSESQQIQDMGNMVREAASSGLGSTKAKKGLAQAAQLNLGSMEAAKRLDIELPPDVFSDNPQVVASAGLTRSVAGSDAEGAWRTSVIKAADRADEVMSELDATTDVASMSDNVRSKLLTTRKDLFDSAKRIYDEVDLAVPKSSKVELNSLRSYVDNLVGEVGEGGLNSAEKRLKNLLDSGEPITYARLIREKNILGDKLKGVGPLEGDLDSASVKRLYGALATDQLDNVGQIVGADLQTKLKGANALYTKERALSKRIVNAYGSETDGSIASLMGRAVKSAQKGDNRDLTKLLKVVPKELQAEVLASAIMANTRSRAGNSLVKGGFGFSEFTDFYRGLRQNEPIYNKMVQVLGKEKTDILRDMYEVSKRVTAARANVLTTGKANQALVKSMTAEGVMGGLINAANTGVGRATTTGGFATVFGPAGAAAAQLGIDFLAKARPDRIKAAGKLFTDERFQKLMVDVATKPNSPTLRNQIKAVIRSPNFRVYANKINLPPNAYEAFMLSAIQAQEEQ